MSSMAGEVLASRRSAGMALLGAVASLVAACAPYPAGYGYSGGLGYYQPYLTDYGGWGPGYVVAPYRAGYRFDHDAYGFDHDAHGFRGGGRGFPSLPSHGRMGGGFAGGHGGFHGGGFHGGGGGHH